MHKKQKEKKENYKPPDRCLGWLFVMLVLSIAVALVNLINIITLLSNTVCSQACSAGQTIWFLFLYYVLQKIIVLIEMCCSHDYSLFDMGFLLQTHRFFPQRCTKQIFLTFVTCCYLKVLKIENRIIHFKINVILLSQQVIDYSFTLHPTLLACWLFPTGKVEIANYTTSILITWLTAVSSVSFLPFTLIFLLLVVTNANLSANRSHRPMWWVAGSSKITPPSSKIGKNLKLQHWKLTNNEHCCLSEDVCKAFL